MITEQTEEQASLYVLGLLPPDETRAIEAVMASDAEVAAMVAGLETAAAALAWTAPPRDPPAGFKARIDAQLKRGDAAREDRIIRFPKFMFWAPWAAAACLTILVGRLAYSRYHLHLLVGSFIVRDRNQQAELDHLNTERLVLQSHLDKALAEISAGNQRQIATDAELDSMRAQLADLRARDTLSQIKIATLASMLKNAPQALAVVAWDPASQRGILQTQNMPPARPDQDYQLWIIDPGYKSPVSAGVFDPSRRADFAPLQRISQASKFAISLEKKGGAPTPQGPIVLVGE